MSAHSLAGLAVLNALYLVAGAAFLWMLGRHRSWIDVARLAGLAYMVGVALTGTIWTLLLIVGAPFSLAVVLAVPTILALVFVIAGRRLGRTPPRGARLQGGQSLLVTAIGIATAGVLLEGFLRTARLSGLYGFDAWSFWVPKAKAIYFFGGLDEQFFTELPGAAYPLLAPTLDAAAFFVMGSPDVVTLHVQYWLFAVGFVWAVAGLLAERVPPWLIWPSVLLLLVAPRIGRRFLITEADLFLDYLFVLAAVLLALWILERDRWRLVVATVLLSAMVSTKREGLLLATVLLVTALVTTARTWRASWPALGLSALVAAAVAAPWRIWYVAHDIEGEGGSGGLIKQDAFGRLWSSARRALEVFWDAGYWNLIVPLFVVALVLAALAKVGKLAFFFGTLTALVVAGGVWATWVFSQTGPGLVLGGNFIIRFMGAAVLLCAAATPLLLSAAWRAADGPERRPAEGSRLSVAAAIVVVPLLLYPAVAIAGGAPVFPNRGECARPADADAPDLEVVYGRLDDRRAADELLASLTRVGFVGTELSLDPCGRWKVSYDAIESLAQGEALAAQARDAGFDARVEHGD